MSKFVIYAYCDNLINRVLSSINYHCKAFNLRPKKIKQNRMNLIEYLNQHIHVEEEMRNLILSSTQLITIKKRQLLMKPNTPLNSFANSMIFVEQGLLRVYSLKKGVPVTMRFIKENNFTFSIERNILKLSDDYSWEAIEDTVIRTMDFQEFEESLNKYSDLEKLTRNELFKILYEYQHLLNIHRTHTAAEKFNYLMQNSPDLFLRAQQGHIASYLGITPQVLSVMRKKNKKSAL